ESTLGDPVVPERPIVTDTGEVIAAVPEGVTSLEQRAETGVDRYGGEDADMAAAPADELADMEAEEGKMAPGAVAGGTGKGRAAEKDKRVTTAIRTGAPPPPPMAPAPMPESAPKQDLSKAERRKLALQEAQRQGLSAPRRMSALAAVAIETGTTRYEIPNPVTVPDESATMVMLLNQ